MVLIEQKDWAEEDRASKLGQNHPLDSTKRLLFFATNNELRLKKIKEAMWRVDESGTYTFSDATDLISLCFFQLNLIASYLNN
jgi:hypothetical protein